MNHNLKSDRTLGVLKKSFNRGGALAAALLLMSTMLMPLTVRAQSDSVPRGTRFLVELSQRLDAGKVHRGRRFRARTLEAIQTEDGQVIPAGAEVTGRVAYVRKDKMQLEFDRIRADSRLTPIVANVVGVEDEHGVKANVDDEGEISSTGGGRIKHGVVGALIGGAIGAGVGAAADGGSGAVKGAAIGGGGGAAVGSLKGHKRLVLPRGTRIRLELGAPLVLAQNGD